MAAFTKESTSGVASPLPCAKCAQAERPFSCACFGGQGCVRESRSPAVVSGQQEAKRWAERQAAPSQPPCMCSSPHAPCQALHARMRETGGPRMRPSAHGARKVCMEPCSTSWGPAAPQGCTHAAVHGAVGQKEGQKAPPAGFEPGRSAGPEGLRRPRSCRTRLRARRCTPCRGGSARTGSWGGGVGGVRAEHDGAGGAAGGCESRAAGPARGAASPRGASAGLPAAWQVKSTHQNMSLAVSLSEGA
jgi:hypothetical protein